MPCHGLLSPRPGRQPRERHGRRAQSGQATARQAAAGRAGSSAGPDRTRADILAAATQEFAERGLAGARVDEIAARTRTAKRMIYYYFGGKEQLYVAVLEQAYSTIRGVEQDLDVADLDPVAAIRRLAEATFDHHESHPTSCARSASRTSTRPSTSASPRCWRTSATRPLDLIGSILERGREAGAFSRAAEALDVHMVISSFCVFRVANRYTWRALFGRDLMDPALQPRYRQMVGDLVVDYLTKAPAVLGLR